MGDVLDGLAETEIEPELNLGFQALIPEDYIAEGKQRLQYYKELSSCRRPINRPMGTEFLTR